MDAVVRQDNSLRTDISPRTNSYEAMLGVSWASIAAGAVAAAALTLALLALGAGLGLSSISPWADSGVSASTFKIGAGVYLVLVAVMASAVGGYLAARLRTSGSACTPMRFSSGIPRMDSSRGCFQRCSAPAFSQLRPRIS
jgi:hypothetical protein